MKRCLALLLTAVLLGLVPFAGAAFKDEKIISDPYRAAVEEMAGSGVISGFTVILPLLSRFTAR